MQTTARALTVLFALAFTAVPVADAAADSTGAAGRVVELRVNGSGSDDYGKFRGSVKIRTPGKKGRTTEYKWGGTTCPSKDLTPEQVAILADAFARRANTHVLPRTKNGQGGAKCLVAFDLRTPRKRTVD